MKTMDAHERDKYRKWKKTRLFLSARRRKNRGVGLRKYYQQRKCLKLMDERDDYSVPADVDSLQRTSISNKLKDCETFEEMPTKVKVLKLSDPSDVHSNPKVLITSQQSSTFNNKQGTSTGALNEVELFHMNGQTEVYLEHQAVLTAEQQSNSYCEEHDRGKGTPKDMSPTTNDCTVQLQRTREVNEDNQQTEQQLDSQLICNSFQRKCNTEENVCSQSTSNNCEFSDEADFLLDGISFMESQHVEGIGENIKLSFHIEGRRIVDLGYLINSIQSIGRHEPFDCTFADMKVIGEKRLGFCSVLIFKCSMCNILKSVRTEKPKSSEEMMNVNASAVAGIITTGGGLSQLEEICASLNMPCISNETWRDYHDKVSESLNKTVSEVMEEAGREEAELAKAAGEVDKDGIPLITVVADGAWAKRSYKMKYDSLSGVAAIIGYKTKKVLYVGVRNKFCSVCSRNPESGRKSPSNHKCAKNWTGVSSSMEQDIIVEGFMNSVEMRGLKYHKLIGDGDSNVHRKLIDCMPYGPELPVQKIECRNHILRNYMNKVRDLCSNTKIGSTVLRNVLRDKALRLRTAVISAIKYRKNQINLREYIRVTALKKDILNSPHHIFGDHTNCRERAYFCDGSPKPGEVNYIPEMKDAGILEYLQAAIQRVGNNATSLIYDVDNNISEVFNSVVAKLVGGKRINFSLRDSYQTRCNAAAVSMNKKSELHRLLHKSAVKRSPGYHTKVFIERRKKRTENTKRRRLLFPGKQRKRPTRTDDGGNSYGPDVSVIQEDMSESEYEKCKAQFLSDLENEDRKEIEETTREQSSSHTWRVQRSKRLTSSFFGKVCKMKPTTSCANLVKEIRYHVFKGNVSTCWGLQKEPVALAQFSEQSGVSIKSSGLIVDEDFPFLAASPDGLIGKTEIVEVKCPASARDMSVLQAVEAKKIQFLEVKDGKVQLKEDHNYMYQVQGVLHISKRQTCHFIVWTSCDMVALLVEKDNRFWEEKMLCKLKKFYFNCVLPEIIDSRHARKLAIRDPDYIIEAQESKKQSKSVV